MITMTREGNAVKMYQDGVFAKSEKVEVCKCGKDARSAEKTVVGRTDDGRDIIQPWCKKCGYGFERDLDNN